MKRSEAVRIIEEVLRGAYDYPALTILTKLEDAGMLPPPDDIDVVTSAVIHCHYQDKLYKDEERLVVRKDSYGKLDYKRSKLWESE